MADPLDRGDDVSSSGSPLYLAKLIFCLLTRMRPADLRKSPEEGGPEAPGGEG